MRRMPRAGSARHLSLPGMLERGSVTSLAANHRGGAAGGGLSWTQVCECSDGGVPLLSLLTSRQEGFCGVPAVRSPVIVNKGNRVSSEPGSRSSQRAATTNFRIKNDEGKRGARVKLCHVSFGSHIDNIQIEEL